MKKIIIEKLNEGHPAKAHGFNYSAKVVINGIYCGTGKFCKTLEEVEEFQRLNA